jgi:hypothetical protein
MPEGGQIEGCQVRWTWENLEPGPQDDFTIWLIRQERWEELEAARIRAIEWPDDGGVWLDLADTYRRLILGKYRFLPGFGETYQPLGVQAAQEALRLLPGDGRPHYELAVFYLAALPENPTAEDLGPLLDELRNVAGLAPAYEGDVRDWMEFILSSDQWNSLNEKWATETAVAALTLKPSLTPAKMLKLTSTPIPSATVQPPPTPTVMQPGNITSDGRRLVILVAAGAIGLVVVGYLVVRIMRKRGGK